MGKYRHNHNQRCLVKTKGLFMQNILLQTLGSVITLLFLLLPPNDTLAGTIKGTVKVQGLRTAENIMVYLDGIEMPGGAGDTTKFVMNQENLTFSPHILPIPAGSIVEFPNNDKVDHNVFSLSKTSPFNLGTYQPGVSKDASFDKPGIVKLRCDVHAEMIAYIMVLKNPYATFTDSKGQFELPGIPGVTSAGSKVVRDIPAGSYRLRLWHEKLRPASQKITVPEKGEVAVQLTAKRGPAGSVLYK
jgi:plastocyanin